MTFRITEDAVDGLDDDLDQINVLPFVEAADIVGIRYFSLMENVVDFTLDAKNNALICVTQEGVVSFGIDTGRKTTLYAGGADQAAMCGDALLVRTGGSIVRVANGQSATIRRDGATLMGVYGQKVIQLTNRGVMTCDVNGENVTTILHGSFDTMSIANGVLYVGDQKGYTQYVTL